jgi:hypothetical protein
MKVTGDTLLEGPRGRRLCLELAMALAPDLAAPVMYLSSALDPATGTSQTSVIFAVSDGDGPEPASGLPAAASTTHELAEMLASRPVAAPAGHLIQAALEASVSNARYWQEPDGEDLLAALPAVRKALHLLAGRAAASDLGQSYTRSRRREQWHIDWRSMEDRAPLPRSSREAVSAWARAARVEEERAATERPRDPRAPWSGTWWSFPQGLLQTVGQIPAGLSLIEDAMGEEHATVIPVRGAGRTFEVTLEEDWVRLCREYPLDVTASRRHDWFRTTGREGSWVIPDWERVAEDWDAVHLPVLGYLRCAGRALRIDAERASVIAGWSPDTTIWLSDIAREWAEPRQEWRRSQDGCGWTRTR